MNRLWVRLTLSFVAVTLIGVLTVAGLADFSAGQEFSQYVARQDVVAQSSLLDDLTAFYQQNGNWDGVSEILSNAPGSNAGGRGRGMMRGRPALVFADANGIIIYDERNTRMGSALDSNERANALSVLSNGATVGYLVVSAPERGTLAPAAQNFLDQLRGTLMIAALVAGGLGILLGLVISRTLAAPLANLAQAARAMAAHRLEHRVAIQGADEIADVARAFNEMADELQTAEKLRRNMIADIAHELRTPLAVMQGNLTALLDEVYPLERGEIATLYDETRLLSRLVDDLRELSLADAGLLSLNRQPIEILPLLRAAVENFSLAADAQNIRLEVQAGENLPRVDADADRLAQILRNLLANALRHTPSGENIRCLAEVKHAKMRISVCDTGEGIAPEDLPHVFERFYRTEKSRARAQGGTGLGLAIAKSWVEAMGGEIGVESTRGQGSCFWFTLPLSNA